VMNRLGDSVDRRYFVNLKKNFDVSKLQDISDESRLLQKHPVS
jgi:hypothetical protein